MTTKKTKKTARKLKRSEQLELRVQRAGKADGKLWASHHASADLDDVRDGFRESFLQWLEKNRALAADAMNYFAVEAVYKSAFYGEAI